MGVELHITRTPEGSEVEVPIPESEWLAYVSSDPELEPWPEQGPDYFRWLGKSAYPEPWLHWSHGEVSSKWPDTALYHKMLSIAVALGARVRDDEDTTYASQNAWQFDPNSPPVVPRITARPWWRRLFGRDA